uniref:Uncharacterized protein n=1 Tax=Timema poppense TaxID=170557 RepID=A0A7R9CVI8_TIMPO|nr:unnamed protein product [Timema poppensis]
MSSSNYRKDRGQALQSDYIKDWAPSEKVSRLEGELSQALDLAHGYKEKSESSERERQEMIHLHMAETEALTAQLQEMRQHLDEASNEHSRIISAREETEAKLVASQQEVGKVSVGVEFPGTLQPSPTSLSFLPLLLLLPVVMSERSLKENVRKELQKIKQTLSNCEVELLALKEEKAALQLKMKEERNRISVVDQQKRSLQSTLDEAKKREKSLRDELKASNDRLEKVKVDLRDYYQREVEVVVRTKLAEFQGQLDSAETSLRQELEAREKAVTEIAQKQVKQIADKHQLEIRLLEEKHHEEQQLLQLQVSQLQAKLSHFDSQRTEIVERLHGVMETQWKEALRVISGGSIPSRTSSDLGTLGQGKCELPKQPPIDSEEHRKHTSYAVQFAQQAITASKSWDVPPLSLHVRQQSAGSSTTDDHPFCHEGQSTYRVGVAPDNSSRKLHSPSGNPGDELKRYIRMLLDRAPGKPLGEHLEVPTTESGQMAPVTRWEHTGDQLDSSRNKQSSLESTLLDLPQGTTSNYTKDNQTSKLPWK